MTGAALWELFFYCCVNLLPALALTIITCRDFLRFSLKTTIALSAGVLLWYFGCTAAYDARVLSYLTVNIVLNAAYILFGVLLTRGKPWQLFFALGIVLNYGSVCAITATGAFYAIDLQGVEFGWQTSLVTLFIAAIFWFLYDWLLVKRLRPLFAREESEGLWRVLWLVPALFCIIHYFCIWTQSGQFAARPLNVAFLVILNLGSAFVSYLVANMVDERAERGHLEAENQRLAMQAAQYENLRSRMEEMREARHDLRQHLRLMQSYLDGNNETALREYLKAYGQTLPADTGMHYCENTVADTVVRYYAELAQAQGIAFSARLELSETLSLPEPELCVLLGNLLENALDSCKKHPDDSPYIRMGGRLVGSRMLTVIVDNCPADEPKREHGALLSSKHLGIGTGTASIQAIAKRYCGQARFQWKDGVFSAEVVLTLPEKSLS